ncbi:MAG: winged helix-turn-helix domain-containing protein [Ferroplasma sp.]
MDSQDILDILKDGEKTQNEVIEAIIGGFDISERSKEQYLKLGAQILVESEIEFLLNDLINAGRIGIKHKKYGTIEQDYYYIIDLPSSP